MTRSANTVRLLLLVAPLLLVGCYQPFDNQYISLQKSMEVIEHGETALPNVFGDSEIPVAYMLNRPTYTLFATLDTSSIRPSIVFEVESSEAADLTIEGESIPCLGAFSRIRPDEATKLDFPTGALRFTWYPSNHADCQAAKQSAAAAKVLKVYVSICYGDVVVSKEELIFEILANGVHWVYNGP